MNQTTPKTITVTVSDSSCDDKIEITLNKYSDLNDWIKVFKTILIHQTFCEDTVKDLFEDSWEEYEKAMEDKKEIEYNSSFNIPPSFNVLGKEDHAEENYKETIEQVANRLCGLSCGTAVDAVLKYVKRPDCSKAQTQRLISELTKLQ